MAVEADVSHNHRFRTKEFGEVVVNVSGGWVGTAEVLYKDSDGEDRRVQVPAALLIKLGKEVAKAALSSMATRAIESWKPDDET